MASDYAEARRIAADQFDRESQMEREAASKTRLGAVLHSLRNALGKDRAQQERDAAAQRAREDAERQAEAERQRALQVEQERQAQARELAGLRAAVPERYSALARLVVGREHERTVLWSLKEKQLNRALSYLSLDMGLIETDRQYFALRYLANDTINNILNDGPSDVPYTAVALEALTKRMNGYDAQHGIQRRWEDSPASLHRYLWNAVERHNSEKPHNQFNLAFLPGAAGERWKREQARQKARRASHRQSRSDDFSPGF